MISLAVLDIAGTTVDVTDGVPDALEKAFARFGLTVSKGDIQAVRGISKRDAIRSLLETVAPSRAGTGLDGEILQAFRTHLAEWYRVHPIAPLPGAVEAIQSLKERGVMVWLSTGFDRELGAHVVERAGLAGLIDGLATDDDVERGRPAPDLIRFAMRNSGVADPRRVVAVGDTCADLEAAEAAGVGCAVGVLSGAHDRARLSGRSHDLLLSGIGDLPEALERLGLVSEALASFGWDGRWAEAFHGMEAGDGEPGRVTSQHRGRWTIQGASGAHPARLVGAAQRASRPVTGDWVVCRPGPHPSDPWGIVSVLPRRSAVRRGAAGDAGGEQVLAANVDRLWIVHALDLPPNLRSVERYLSVAWESGALPEVVLTKSDLAQDLETAVRSVREIAIGVPIWVVSVEDAAALQALSASLARGATVALLGPSGAGKSTLINHLAEAHLAPTGDVRAHDRKGRHTTTSRQLFPIWNGALLLDTPGMRELKVVELGEGLERTFPEIDALAASCRFRDCSHASEPGCAVLAAVAEGSLPESRLASFRKLQAEAAFERRRTDPLERAAHVAEHKTALKTVKVHPKYRRDG